MRIHQTRRPQPGVQLLRFFRLGVRGFEGGLPRQAARFGRQPIEPRRVVRLGDTNQIRHADGRVVFRQ